ncbi:MAG: site-2 protease family protein [Methanomassiliicoccus sp.]|nr:site-2 protease family protein [Methanomassiliicoccus sp.]
MSDPDVTAYVEEIRSLVTKYFPVYEVTVNYDAIKLMVRADEATLGPKFEDLRKEMKTHQLIPFINYSKGEHAITVVRSPPARKGNMRINQVLLAITFITTTLSGTLLWADYVGSSDWLAADNILYGALFFALPLMTILGIHELSHYIASKRHGVDASLPYFIPSIPPFGTFGAFISMRDPMPNRKAMVDIGIAGPLGGLAVTIPVAIIGLYLTANGHAVSGAVSDAGMMAIFIQPLYQLLAVFVPLNDGMALHPTAFAAWVGFLVTAINLLPIGQLDGGHVARGLLGDRAKYVGYATFFFLALMTLFYDGWFLFAILVFLLGLKHPAPLNDVTKIDKRSIVLGLAGLVVLAVTFVPQPMVTISPDHSFELNVVGGNNTTAAAGSMVEFTVLINNTGNTDSQVRMSLENIPGNWTASIFLSNGSSSDATNILDLDLGYQTNASVTVLIHLPADATASRTLELAATASGVSVSQDLTVSVA